MENIRSEYEVNFGINNDEKYKQYDQSEWMNPPKKVKDEYYWLRNDDRSNNQIIEFLNDENIKFDNCIDKALSEQLYQEIKSYVNENYDTLPLPHGEGGWTSKYYYFVKTIEGKSYNIHMRKNIETLEEEILLDENILAEGHNTFDLNNFEISYDHKYLSYGIDLDGDENYKLVIQNIDTKELVDHDIPELPYCIYFWHYNDGKHYIFYTLANETRKTHQVYRYDFYTKEHIKIYENLDPLKEVGISVTDDKKYFIISADSFDTHDNYITDNLLNLKQIIDEQQNHKYSIEHHNGNLFIKTNKDGATNFKIMRSTIDCTCEWKPYIEYNKEINITNINVLKDYLIVSYKKNGNKKIKVIPTNDDYNLNNSYDIEIENIDSMSLVSLDIYDTDEIIITYNTLNMPSTLTKYNLKTKEHSILKIKDVPNYNYELYETKRLYAQSHDGVMIPISIVYKKEKLNMNKNKLYLYGYGSYGHTVYPTFDYKIIPLLDHGYIYAIAHVRGGGFLGTEWYEAGKMLTKKNTFYDFIACAEYLINNNYTYKKGIVIEGASAGGLLVGASMILKPELFNTVIANVPFVDVLNTMCDPTIPLTCPEWEQWGNPNIEKFYNYMKEYSPYDNIKENGNYPHILALAGLNDPRVQYWEPAKFIAKLRYLDNNGNYKLLKTEMEQGHFGNTDRYKYMKEKATIYAFVFKTFE
jgi:oligopeptidase B